MNYSRIIGELFDRHVINLSVLGSIRVPYSHGSIVSRSPIVDSSWPASPAVMSMAASKKRESKEERLARKGVNQDHLKTLVTDLEGSFHQRRLAPASL